MSALSSALLDFPSPLPYVFSMGKAAFSVEELLSDLEQQMPAGALRMPFTIREVRKLTEEDLIAGERVKVKAAPKQTLQKIRQSHHSMARMIAMGKNNIEVSETLGVSPGRVSQLKADPAFQELISYYTTMTDQVYVDVAERIAGFTTDAMEVLHERIRETPEQVKNEELLKAIALGLDRTGYGPKSTTNINSRVMVVTDAELDRIKQEASLRRIGSVRTLQADQGPDFSSALPGSLPLQIEAEVEREQSSRPVLREEIREDAESKSSEGSGPEDRSVD